MFCDEAQSLQIPAHERADRSETLGSRSEVEGFRVEPWQGLLVEPFALSEAAQLPDQFGVHSPIRRAHPNIYTGDGSFAHKVMRPDRTRMKLQLKQLQLTPGQDLNLRN